MPKTAADARTTAVSGGAPSAAMRQVGDKLAAHGFEVRFPKLAESRCLSVTNLPGASCDITVGDNGAVTWEYCPGASTHPHRVIALALRLLTDEDVTHPCTGPGATAGFSLLGSVGLGLEARGLDVRLDVYVDHKCFEVGAEVVVRNPARPERGRLRICDDLGLIWETGCSGAHPFDAEAITDRIITTLTGDIADGYLQRSEPELDSNARGSA